jgi:predicted nuclease of predicted toxin-antitoxin system
VKVWLDAQLSPALASWVSTTFGVEATSVRDLGLRDAEDRAVFDAARTAQAVVMTKDHDFVELLQRSGCPPQVIWITVGNTSNARMREILSTAFPRALELIQSGEPLVEVSEAPPPQLREG